MGGACVAEDKAVESVLGGDPAERRPPRFPGTTTPKPIPMLKTRCISSSATGPARRMTSKTGSGIRQGVEEEAGWSTDSEQVQETAGGDVAEGPDPESRAKHGHGRLDVDRRGPQKLLGHGVAELGNVVGRIQPQGSRRSKRRDQSEAVRVKAVAEESDDGVSVLRSPRRSPVDRGRPDPRRRRRGRPPGPRRTPRMISFMLRDLAAGDGDVRHLGTFAARPLPICSNTAASVF